MNQNECWASLAAIHYHAKRLYKMLDEKKQIEECSIVHSIIKECEEKVPGLDLV